MTISTGLEQKIARLAQFRVTSPYEILNNLLRYPTNYVFRAALGTRTDGYYP